MARLNICVFGFVLAVAFCFVQCSTDGTEPKIEIVKDINQFLLKHPGVKMQPLIGKTQPREEKYTIKYHLGSRINSKITNLILVDTNISN